VQAPGEIDVAEQAYGARALQLSVEGAEVPPGPVTVSVQLVLPTEPLDRSTLPLAARPVAEYALAPLHVSVALVAATEVQLTLIASPVITVAAERLKLVMRASATHDATGLIHCPLEPSHSTLSDPLCVIAFVLPTDALA
jgi:hypothetical protein